MSINSNEGKALETSSTTTVELELNPVNLQEDKDPALELEPGPETKVALKESLMSLALLL